MRSLGEGLVTVLGDHAVVLQAHAAHAGQVLTYKSMMKELWGPGVGGDNKLLRVHMANIRRKIEPNPVEPQYIFTEVGVGYRMADSH